MYRKILCFTVLLSIVECRKYDLEAESLKLYGEDVHSVIARFRKSADYMKILQDRLADMNVFVADLGTQTIHLYVQKLEKRIKDMYGIGKQTTDTTSKAASDNIARYFPGDYPSKGRQGETTDKKEEETTKVTESPVKILDGYDKLESSLTLAEKNGFIDIGFEFTGHIIHTIIKNMGPDDLPTFKSTQAFADTDDKKHSTTTTTEHASVHEVTTTSTTTMHIEDTTAPLDSFRYRTSGLH